MKLTLPALLFLFVLSTGASLAQKEATNLTDQQKLGRQILAQSCAVCHLPSGPGAKTYGPALNKATLPDDDDTVRQNILEGNSRMPGFKYFLKSDHVDAIIAYLKTVPAPARPAPAAQQKSEVD